MLIQNKLFKKILLISIALTLLYAFLGDYPTSIGLDKLAYITAIGVDVGEIENYKISFQLSSVHSSSFDASAEGSSSSNSSNSSSSSGSPSPSFVVNTVECDSIDNGISLMNTYTDKTVDLSHCKILLISEELAKSGVSPILNSMINKLEIRPDCNIIVSRIPDEEFKDQKKPTMQDILSEFYNVTTSTENISGYTENVTLNDFYAALQDHSREPFSALGTIRNPKKQTSNSTDSSLHLDRAAKSITSTNKQPIVEILGLCVFKGDRLVGSLSGTETICHLILTNDLDTSTFSIPSPFEKDRMLDLSILLNDYSRIKINISNGSPFVNANISVKAKILSLNNSNSKITPSIVNQIETTAEQYLSEAIYNYLYKTSKNFNSDISGIGRYAAKNFSTVQDWYSYNWLSNYSSSTFKVSVDTTIISGYILTNE